MAKIGKTPAPSGCAISRNGGRFTLTWKIAAKNSSDGQKRRYAINGRWSGAQAIGTTATSTYIDVSTYPLSSVAIQVQDDQKKAKKKVKNLSASAWAGATFTLAIPPYSTASMALNETFWNACNVAWGHGGNAFTSGDAYWYQRTECQTTFHNENEPDDWSNVSVTSAGFNGAESGSFLQREDSISASSILGYVRKFRFRILGKRGYNNWATCSHYYSTPYVATMKSATISKNEAGGINCSLVWNSPTSEFHPIDQTMVQYGIAVPGPGMSCPSGISWTERPAMLDSPGDTDDGDSFFIDTTIDPDYCLFARVVNVHDKNKSYSVPILAKGIISILSTPSNFNVDPVYSTYRVIVSIENESDVPDSNIAIIYRETTNGTSTEQIIGIIPHGVSQMTIQCPNFDIPDEWSLGAFAFVGDYGSYVKTEDTEIVSGKTYYTRSGNEEETATPIEEPTGNPHENGYYELIGELYFITDDTEVVDGKTYYELSEIVPYSYSIVENPVEADLDLYYELDPNVARDVTYTVTESGQTLTFTYSVYEIPNIMMKSQTLWRGGDLPRAPENVIAVTPREGVALVTWKWAWKSADIAELSWSSHDDAWESTDQPETYRINNAHAAKWSIYGLDSGMTWYIRVRLLKTTEGGENPGPWSDIVSLDMASAPNAPILTCSKRSVTHDDTFSLSWEYDSTDGTDQKDAVLRAASLNSSGEVIYGNDIRTNIGTSRSLDLIPDDLGWESGQRYGFVLKVISESEKHSEWSEPEFITVADPLSCSITSTSFEVEYEYALTSDTEIQNGSKNYYTVTGTSVSDPDINDVDKYYELIDGVYSRTNDGVIDTEKTYYTLTGTEVAEPDVSEIGTYYERTEDNILKEMPISISTSIIGGADSKYLMNVSIDRASSYFVDRPDETRYSGYYGETVYTSAVDIDSSEETSHTITINRDDIIGSLDDTAAYKLTVYVMDDLDQMSEDSVYFKVRWSHQAAIPEATVEFDDTYGAVKITPTIDPLKYEEGDTFDIYRLSVDKPVLIVKGGTFGETYVDPYPTIGEYGGHRVVTVTANGDFIANEEDSDMAWIDLDAEDGDIFFSDFPIVNYGEGSFEILYNVDLSTTWTKDFRETRYLGGHIQGDWNEGIHRESTINSVILREDDTETAVAFRRMAEYPGKCHIRTLDGSNYYADIQVSETIPHDEEPTNSYNFKITRVDNDGYDGIELSEWNKIISG